MSTYFGFFSQAFRQVSEKKIKMLFTSLGRSVLEKTVCSVLSTALGHSFPYTDLPVD